MGGGRGRALLAGLLAILLLILPGAARGDAGGGLSVSLVFPPDAPIRNYFEYHLAPGASKADALELSNSSDRPLRIQVYGGDGYNTSDGALTGPLRGEPSVGAGQWISVPARDREVTVGPGQTRRVHFTLAVPPGAAPGDHFGFVFVEPETGAARPAQTSSERPASFQVNVTQRLGICLWERVSGALTSGLKIDGVRKSIEKGRLFLVLDVENTGNTFLKPSGGWTLIAPTGESVAAEPAAPWGYLLPGHPLQVRIPLATSRPLARGAYTLEVSVQYGKETATARLPLTLP